MADRICVYIDGESHYIRSDCAWRELHGPDVGLDRLRYVGQADDQTILVLPKAKVFWTRRMHPEARKSVYFTTMVGNESTFANTMRELRGFDLESHLVPERKPLADRRRDLFKNEYLIEKAKQVDIALTVRMIEDCYRKVFDVCHLYTSDVDFLPVVRAVMAHGTHVCIHGYRKAVPDDSPLLSVPDQFVDLETALLGGCEVDPTK